MVMMEEKRRLHFFSAVFRPFLFILAGNNDMHWSSDEVDFGLIGPTTAESVALERLKKKIHMRMMGNRMSPLFIGCS